MTMSNQVKVEFIDISSETKKMMVKLSKDALKESGKVVTKILKETVPVRSGGLKKSIVAWAKIDYKTGQPYMEVGYRSRQQMRKNYGIKFFVNPTWFEFGTKPHEIMTKMMQKNGISTYKLHDNKNDYGFKVMNPGMTSKNFLRNSVMNHIKEIQEAQEEKLGQLTDLMISQGARIDLGEDEEIE